MTLAVIVVVAVITFLMLGFRIDINNGDIQQYAFLQFSSKPSGATVTIDGDATGSRTPSKGSVPAGKYDIVMWRDGYEIWHKSVDVKSGTLTWLNYALLVPKNLAVKSVANYKSVYLTNASPKGNFMLVQENSNTPTFKLVDLRSDEIKSNDIVIPKSQYTETTPTDTSSSFRIEKWDDSERYVLVSHTYSGKNEWIVVDTQNVSQTKNITKLFDIEISNVVFSGDTGNTIYALDSNDIRRLDLAAGTISKPLVSNVDSFEMFNKTKAITYVGKGKSGTNERVVGIYREGDEEASVVRTVIGDSSVPLHIATSYYFNENYVAISLGKQVDILSGSYPNTTSDNASNMKAVGSFTVKEDVDKLSFSPAGEYVFTQSGAHFASYDLEYQKFASSVIEGTENIFALKWLDDNYIWSDRDGKLTIREFDGANIHTINSVVQGQDATLTNNGRYLYSINKSASGYQLQRVRMILP